MSNEKIRIVVVDDQAVVRQGFVALINTVADMEVIAEGTDGRQAVELYRKLRPDVLLTDLRMPVMTGVEAIAAIRREFPGARVIVLTTFDGDEDIYRSLQAGAQGYLLKDMFFEELEDAIRTVHAGGRRIPGVVAERLAGRVGGSDLTGRELEVLEQIVFGRSNKEIAAALDISEATVKSHVNNILSKLGVADRTQGARPPARRPPRLQLKLEEMAQLHSHDTAGAECYFTVPWIDIPAGGASEPAAIPPRPVADRPKPAAGTLT